MKNILGYYELSEKQREALQGAVGEIFDFDAVNARVLHPTTTPVGYLHIDIMIGEKKDENIYVSSGASSRKRKESPYLEVFAKTKHENTEAYQILCNNLINDVCFNDERAYSPNHYCLLLNGFEYAFLDRYSQYHDMTGYWGLFVVPQVRTTVAGKEYLFYQIIPAYKEELLFVERNANVVDYKKLCEAIIKQIPDRQYFDVKHHMLSEEKLKEILNTLN